MARPAKTRLTLKPAVLIDLLWQAAIDSVLIQGVEGGFHILIGFGSKEQLLGLERKDRPRVFKTLPSAVNHLDKLGVTQGSFNMTRHSPAIKPALRSKGKGPGRAAARERTAQAVAYDAWFRESVGEALAQVDDGSVELLEWDFSPEARKRHLDEIAVKAEAIRQAMREGGPQLTWDDFKRSGMSLRRPSPRDMQNKADEDAAKVMSQHFQRDTGRLTARPAKPTFTLKPDVLKDLIVKKAVASVLIQDFMEGFRILIGFNGVEKPLGLVKKDCERVFKKRATAEAHLAKLGIAEVRKTRGPGLQATAERTRKAQKHGASLCEGVEDAIAQVDAGTAELIRWTPDLGRRIYKDSVARVEAKRRTRAEKD